MNEPSEQSLKEVSKMEGSDSVEWRNIETSGTNLENAESQFFSQLVISGMHQRTFLNNLTMPFCITDVEGRV
jgi:hypothetical protein